MPEIAARDALANEYEEGLDDLKVERVLATDGVVLLM